MIIGLVGRKHSGKDTVAHILVEDFLFRQYSLADPIKDVCKVIFNWDERHVNGDLKEEVDPFWGVSPRQVMQDLGTDWGQFGLCRRYPRFKRVTGRLLWAKHFLRKVQEDQEANWVVSDVRFPHEEGVIRETGGYLVRIYRPGNGTLDFHPSETEMDEITFDWKIMNDGPLTKLRPKVLEMLEILDERT